MNKRRRYKAKARRNLQTLRRRFHQSGNPIEIAMTFAKVLATAAGGEAQRLLGAFKL